MQGTHHKALFLLLLSSLFFPVSAQETERLRDSIPLPDYLRELESAYETKFSYVDETVEGLWVFPGQGDELPALLNDLRLQTGLEIKQLSERYYAISLPAYITVCALVFDNFEENTISGASVQVLGHDIQTITGPDGRFRLEEVPRDATIQLRHLGYKTRFLTASELEGETCPVIAMAILYQQLEEVVVFDILTSGIKTQVDGSITMDVEEFGILPGLSEPDILRGIQSFPGVESIDETVSDINIRGGTNDQNLLLWDGMKMYQSGHFFGLISAFNPYLTEKVTLYKNGTPARLGEGVSGTIDMRTIDEVGDKPIGGAGLNLISGDTYLHLPLGGKTAFQFSARRSVTDFLNTPAYKQFFNRAFQNTEVQGQQQAEEVTQEEEFYFYDLSAKFLYDPAENHRIRVSSLHINNDLLYQETRGGETDQSTLDQTNLSLGLRWEADWTSSFSTHVNTYYTRYNLDAQTRTNNGEQQLFQNNLVEEAAARLSTHWEPLKGIRWENGYQYTETGITNAALVTQPPFESNTKGVLRIHSPFTEMTFQSPSRSLVATAGLRLNHLENPDDFSTWRVEPRLRINTLLLPHLRFILLGELKNQGVGQVVDLEQNFLGIEKRRWFVSDERNLPIARSKQGSAGLLYEDGPWYLSGEAFIKEVKGISTLTQGFQNEGQFDNELGSYLVQGAEFLVNYREADLSTWISYTLNRNNYTFPTLDPSEFPNNLDIRHTATLAVAYTYSDLRVSLGFNYRGGKPYTRPAEEGNPVDELLFPNQIEYEPTNSSRLPDFIRADASAIYDFQLGGNWRGTAGVSVLNLLDRRNVLNAYYRLNEQDEIERVESTSLGLTPNFSLRLRF